MTCALKRIGSALNGKKIYVLVVVVVTARWLKRCMRYFPTKLTAFFTVTVIAAHKNKLLKGLVAIITLVIKPKNSVYIKNTNICNYIITNVCKWQPEDPQANDELYSDQKLIERKPAEQLHLLSSKFHCQKPVSHHLEDGLECWEKGSKNQCRNRSQNSSIQNDRLESLGDNGRTPVL